MRAGHGAIVQAPLAGEGFFGIADVLLRCEMPSALGAWSYEPVDTKLSRETKATTILQLATYCDLLAAAQGIAPEHFHVVTPLAEEPYRLADFAAYFRFVRSRFRWASSVEPAPATYPDPVGHCDVCKYWRHCDDRRRADDHPWLIAGIRHAHVREFQAQAIATVAAIADRLGALPQAPKRGGRKTYAVLGHQAKLQVAARSLSPPPFDCLPVEAGKGFARLPVPSPGDIFLDFEGDPFVGEKGLEYLTGWHVREIGPRAIGAIAPPGVTSAIAAHGPTSAIAAAGATRGEIGPRAIAATAAPGMTLTQLWALDATAERAAVERFIDFAMERWQRYPDLHIYHFGAYEPSALKRLCARYATRNDDLDRFLRSGRFVDLHTVVREAMRIGIERYGLKELEVLHAFKREQDLAEAGISRRDVELALELGDASGITQELRDQVARYNAEDCASTESLRDWLEARRAEQVAAGCVIERPPEKEAAPSEDVGERDQRIQELQAELRAMVDPHPGPLPDPLPGPLPRERELLASMLGYFRQEEKNAYWEHFRLRDLPVKDHIDEREMLAGL